MQMLFYYYHQCAKSWSPIIHKLSMRAGIAHTHVGARCSAEGVAEFNLLRIDIIDRHPMDISSISEAGGIRSVPSNGAGTILMVKHFSFLLLNDEYSRWCRMSIGWVVLTSRSWIHTSNNPLARGFTLKCGDVLVGKINEDYVIKPH